MERIETQRLILRPFCESDLNDFFDYCQNPNIGPNAGWKPHKSIEESREILQSFMEGNEVLAIEVKSNGKVVGSVGIEEDERRPKVPRCKMLGYVLSEKYWGKGIMTEAARAALGYAFTAMNLGIVSVYHYPLNSRSKRVIEKLGFKFEGVYRMSSVIYNGSILDNWCYSMTRREYFLKSGNEKYQLRLPEEITKENYLSFISEWKDEKIVPAVLKMHDKSYEYWLRQNIRFRTEVPTGFVTATTWFLTDNSGIPIGALDLRHRLNDDLGKFGGHIGYGVRPSFRGRYCASAMLALGLEKAREIGLERVLITCDDDNIASAKTIESCGGILENSVEENGNLLRRYWIDI